MKLAAQLAALLAASVGTLAEPVCDVAEVAEVNAYYDGEGRLVFTQLIWWDDLGNVIAWRLVKDGKPLPKRDWSRGDYVATWLDGETFREVRARTLAETWTQYDPEVMDREILPTCWRRGLTPAGRAK